MKYKMFKSILINMEHEDLVKLCLDLEREKRKLRKILKTLPKDMLEDIKDMLLDYYGVDSFDFLSIDGYMLENIFNTTKKEYKKRYGSF